MQIRMERKLYESISEEAEKRGINVSGIARMIFIEWLRDNRADGEDNEKENRVA